ncbi:MAG: 14.7 kDa ribonuclease H-like protein [candidate division WS6 bacterium OLB20]|uniref:14.7 kDa ribonuclease H-like protein n=1 Tax=candidate division WS6 bacterium OLB20 TaxID=1617426 RepID=A0A136M075_9BACT|nr:MAG: 14.7 kDa ribonuclease H-like protein [candidate division WS6 bacterium OLB20]
MEDLKGRLFTDGGARGNPGPAGLGAILFAEDHRMLGFDARYGGELTNNQAEYRALLMGLDLAIEHGIRDLLVYMDSELAVKQMKGEYRVKNDDIAQLKTQVDARLAKFDSVGFIHVPREQNRHADRLVNIVLDSRS